MSTKSSGGAQTLRKVFRFAASHWRRQALRAGWITTLMIAGTTLDLLVPVFAGRLVDAVTRAVADRAAAVPAIVEAILIMAALTLGSVALRHFAMMGIIQLTLRSMQEVAEEAFARVQRFSSDWHANTFAGSTVRQITRGLWALDLLNDTVVIAFVPAFVVLAGSSLLFAWHSPWLGLAVALGAASYLGLQVYFSITINAPAAKLANAWDTRLGGAIADAVSCNAVVKGFGAEEREDRRLTTVLKKWRARSNRQWVFGTWTGTTLLTLLALMRTAILGGAAWLWVSGRFSPGDVVFAMASYAVVEGYLREMGQHIRNMQRSVNDMEDLVEFHAQPLDIADRPGARPLAIGKGEIAFEHVTFHYGRHAEPLYRDLSVRIRPGERVALVGHSGSGKTTFVKLVQRLHDVTGGRVTVDGTDVRDVTQVSLRRGIAIVQQDPVLFHRSLQDNIAYARPGATLAEVEAAARLANAHGFISALPKGYATLVGERGVKLSGGERQRVALARAFLADAPILILDEATSSLDAESEALVQDAIHRLMRGRTTIVIAHRLSTVRAMDRLLVFDKGRIVEEGDHETLMHHEGGIYRRLFERQVAALADEIAA
jgi:ATP-binding cassette subfamily B protein